MSRQPIGIDGAVLVAAAIMLGGAVLGLWLGFIGAIAWKVASWLL